MRLPVLTRATKFGERQADRGSGPVGVEPQDCSLPKKIACASAVAACAAVCIGTGGAGCAACFAGLGMGSCIDCL